MRKKTVAQIELVAEERKLKSEQSGPGTRQPNDCQTRAKMLRAAASVQFVYGSPVGLQVELT